MSVRYIIDGYNLIWAADNFGGGRLQDQRERLLRYIEKSHPTGSLKNKVTVVFDGKEDVDSPPWKGPTRVIFSRGEDADAVIKRAVDEMGNPREAIVVTDDRDIQKWVRASHAKIISCGDFLKGSHKRKFSTDSSTETKPLPDPISNEEFRRLWEK